jgi:hypothetical protein
MVQALVRYRRAHRCVTVSACVRLRDVVTCRERGASPLELAMNTFYPALLLVCITTPASWLQPTRADADAAKAAAQKGWMELLSVQAAAYTDLARADAKIAANAGVAKKVLASMSEDDVAKYIGVLSKSRIQFGSADIANRSGDLQAAAGEDYRARADAAYMGNNWYDAVRYYGKAKEHYAAAVEEYRTCSRMALLSNETAANVSVLLGKYQK